MLYPTELQAQTFIPFVYAEIGRANLLYCNVYGVFAMKATLKTRKQQEFRS